MVANSFSDDDARRLEDMKRKLAQIRSHDGDPDWFGSHESSTRNTIRRVSDKAPLYLDTVITAFVCLRNLHTHKTYQLWAQIIADLLLVADDLRNPDLQSQLWLAYADFMMRAGQHKMASRAAEIGTAFLPDRSEPDIDMRRAQASLLLIRAQQPVSSKATTIRLIARALKYARSANNSELKARVYQTLGHIYVVEEDYKPAIGFTELALNLWKSLDNELGRIDCMINLARIARMENRFEEMNALLQEISLDPDSPNGHQQFMNRMYEEAAFHLELAHYDSAEETIKWVIEYLETMNMPRAMGVAKQTLALIQISQQRFDLAEDTLTKVDEIWNKHEYVYGQADVCVARCYLERMRKQEQRAIEWLDRAERICFEIKNETMRKQMQTAIHNERLKGIA